MELQFHKSLIDCLQPVLQQMQTQELTQEVRLTEGMPDVGKVVGAWGQVLLRGKQWSGNSAGVSGGIMAWVVYLPEDGSEARCMETWLPLQMKWDVPDAERDGSICVMPRLQGIDARCVSARKLMVRATAAMQADAYVPAQVELYEAQDLPEDLRALKHQYPVQLPKEVGEKAFSLEETIQLPAESMPMQKLLRYTLRPELTDKKVMTDKLIFRGNAWLDILYRGTDGQIYGHQHEMPFSQYADLDREYDSTAEAQVCFAVTNLEVEQAEEDGISVKVGMIAQYVIKERTLVELIQDSYSPKREVTPVIEQLKLPTVLEDKTQTLSADLSANSDCLRLIDTVFYPGQSAVYRESDAVGAEFSGTYQILGYDGEGQLRSETHPWNGTWSVPADSDSRVSLTVEPIGKARGSVAGGTADMTADMQLHWQTTAQNGMPMVTGLEIGEEKKPDPNRPSLILRRADKDSLWDIAKQSGSDVEQIQKLNNLQQDPMQDQMLLIPVL